MNSIEALNFFDRHVKGRFSKWEPSPAEIDDWLYWLKGMDSGVALNAIREHKSESRFNAPALSVFREKARKFMPQQESKAKPDPTIFVMYEGGGRGTLVVGFYTPVIVLPKEEHQIGKAAERLRAWHEDHYGGIWKVYSQTTADVMNKMRSEMRAAITNA